VEDGFGGAGGFGVADARGAGLVGLGSDGLVAFAVRVGSVDKNVGVAVGVLLGLDVGLGVGVPVAVSVGVGVPDWITVGVAEGLAATGVGVGAEGVESASR
jgi:hypothetical protein